MFSSKFNKSINWLRDCIPKKINGYDKFEIGVVEFFKLLWLNLLCTIRNFVEYMKIISRYYSHLSFFKADLLLVFTYLFHNPFSISKRFLMKKGEKNVYAYGETPLTSMEIIAREANIGKKDCVYELGAGRGRTCFWLNSFKGCSVVGIEYIREFVDRGNSIAQRLGFSRVKFVKADMCEMEFPGATVCYLYGTCLEDSQIKQLIEQFSVLPSGTKIITVSYSLADYTSEKWFEVMKRFTVPYTWGEADVFIHVIR